MTPPLETKNFFVEDTYFVLVLKGKIDISELLQMKNLYQFNRKL